MTKPYMTYSEPKLEAGTLVRSLRRGSCESGFDLSNYDMEGKTSYVEIDDIGIVVTYLPCPVTDVVQWTVGYFVFGHTIGWRWTHGHEVIDHV